MVEPLAWSWSRIKEYGQCPRKFNEKHIAKTVKEKPSDAMRWGADVHTALEKRIRNGIPLPAGMSGLEKYAISFGNARGKTWTERKLAVSNELEPREYFDKDVACRGVADVLIINGPNMVVVDWKTGKKIGDEDHLQIELLAVLAMCHFPDVEICTAALVYTAIDDRQVVTIVRNEIPTIWASFQPQVKRMRQSHADNDWPENPSGLCGWCPVRQCQHHP